MTGTAVEVITSEQIADALLGQGDVAVLDADEIQQDIVRRILAAESAEEAHAQIKAVGAKDLEGVLITVHGVTWAKSGFEQGPAVYALLDVTADGDEEHLTVSMGGRSVMAAFLWDQMHAAFPVHGTFKMERSQTNPDRGFWTFLLKA